MFLKRNVAAGFFALSLVFSLAAILSPWLTGNSLFISTTVTLSGDLRFRPLLPDIIYKVDSEMLTMDLWDFYHEACSQHDLSLDEIEECDKLLPQLNIHKWLFALGVISTVLLSLAFVLTMYTNRRKLQLIVPLLSAVLWIITAIAFPTSVAPTYTFLKLPLLSPVGITCAALSSFFTIVGCILLRQHQKSSNGLGVTSIKTIYRVPLALLRKYPHVMCTLTTLTLAVVTTYFVPWMSVDRVATGYETLGGVIVNFVDAYFFGMHLKLKVTAIMKESIYDSVYYMGLTSIILLALTLVNVLAAERMGADLSFTPRNRIAKGLLLLLPFVSAILWIACVAKTSVVCTEFAPSTTDISAFGIGFACCTSIFSAISCGLINRHLKLKRLPNQFINSKLSFDLLNQQPEVSTTTATIQAQIIQAGSESQQAMPGSDAMV